MLLSLAYMLLGGMFAGWICKKIHLPSLLGMILVGILLGPHMGNWIDDSILNISAELRKIALIIILLRAGLSLNMKDLKKVGRPAILMCFVPACFEIVGMVLIAPRLFSISMIEAAIMGAVVAAVSPAVIVPKMIKLMEEGYGVLKGIPQLILAGASVDDVFVIVIFTALTGVLKGGDMSFVQLIRVPISILLGVVIGCIMGYVLTICFEKLHIRDSEKIILILSIAFILVTMEDRLENTVPFSGLIAVMVLGITLQGKRKEVAQRLSAKCSRLWVPAEILLFVLVGATVDVRYARMEGYKGILLILLVLVFRMVGVWCCMIKTVLTRKERLFCMFAYTPKATVQAAIGGIPLAMGFNCGNLVLTIAVLAILITAPMGAFVIDASYKKLL